MAKRAARPSVLAEGCFGAFVLDQLSGLGGVEARPMFGGAGFYLDGEFFGILYEEQLYFRVSPDTIGDYTSRKMKPFAPFEEGEGGESRGYYEVPIEILESAERSDRVGAGRAATTPRADRVRCGEPRKPA